MRMINYLQQYLRDLVGITVFAALVAAGFLLRRLPGWFRSLRAANWPTTEGRIETVDVKAFGEQALAELGYSYLVEGNRYSGYYSQQFGDEQFAWNYVTALQGQFVFVRYKSGNPDVSALRSADQQSLISMSRSGSDGRIRLLSTMPVARDPGSRA